MTSLASLRLVTVAGVIAGSMTAFAQTPKPANNDPVQTFYLKNTFETNSAQEILISLRLMLQPSAKLYLDTIQNAIVARTSPDDMVLIQKIITDLDRPASHLEGDAPHRSFRLTYTVTESENGKRVSLQHFSTLLSEGAKTVLKDGSNVPIPIGRPTPGDMVQQFSFLDVGLNIESLLDSSINGERLRTKIERASAVVDSSSGVQNPLKRQSSMELTAYLTPGKPLVLGAFDVPESGRHVEVEALLEPLR